MGTHLTQMWTCEHCATLIVQLTTIVFLLCRTIQCDTFLLNVDITLDNLVKHDQCYNTCFLPQKSYLIFQFTQTQAFLLTKLQSNTQRRFLPLFKVSRYVCSEHSSLIILNLFEVYHEVYHVDEYTQGIHGQCKMYPIVL